MKTIVLYNPLSGNSQGKKKAEGVKAHWGDRELDFRDIREVRYGELFAELGDGDAVCLCGGDGTINRFVNDNEGVDIPCDIFFYATGTGSDFWHELGYGPDDAPIKINEYIKDLPTVEIGGRKMRFLNGVGYGIDGYCCEVGDKMREESPGKPINYAGIAIKGLLFHFKPRRAEITVDGETHVVENAWIAPTMNGKCYGGGMYPTPAQDRFDPERRLTTMVMHGKGRIATLAIFPSIFKGEHVKHEKRVVSFTGREITVKFDRPTPAQVDGETFLDITEYTVRK